MATLTYYRPAAAATRRSLRSLLDLHRSRRALAQLDDAALNDLGLTRAQANAEAARPFWDMPAAWPRCHTAAEGGKRGHKTLTD